MARDDACFGVPDLRRREQGLLTVNALDGVYHPRASLRPGCLLSRARVIVSSVRHDPLGRPGSQRADRQPAAHRKIPSVEGVAETPPLHRLRSVHLPEPLDGPQFVLILEPEVEPANSAGRKVMRWTS